MELHKSLLRVVGLAAFAGLVLGGGLRGNLNANESHRTSLDSFLSFQDAFEIWCRTWGDDGPPLLWVTHAVQSRSGENSAGKYSVVPGLTGFAVSC